MLPRSLAAITLNPNSFFGAKECNSTKIYLELLK